MPFQVQDNDPSSYRGLSVMQMVPLGGKRALQREVARQDVAVEEYSESRSAQEPGDRRAGGVLRLPLLRT